MWLRVFSSQPLFYGEKILPLVVLFQFLEVHHIQVPFDAQFLRGGVSLLDSNQHLGRVIV